jgi:hypothetical protein
MKYALHFMGQAFNGINIQRGKNLTPVEHPEGTRFNGTGAVNLAVTEVNFTPLK